MATAGPRPHPRSAAEWARTLTAPLLLIVLVGLLVAGMVWGWRNVVMPPPSVAPSAACATRSATPYGASDVVVGVYNGGARSGAAGQVAQNLRTLGFSVKTVANTDERVTRTIVRGARADSPAVLLVAGFFPGAEVAADNRPTDVVDVLIGSEMGPMATSAPTRTSLPAPGCGPTSPVTPGASPTAARR